MKQVIRYSLLVLVLSGLAVLDAPDTIAQRRSPLITARVGVMQVAHFYSRENSYTLYPEIQVIGRIISDVGGFSVDGSFYTGMWQTGEEGIFWSDHGPDRMDYNSLLLGTRLNVVTGTDRYLLTYIFGLSRQYLWSERDNCCGREKNMDVRHAFELGVGVQVMTAGNIYVEAGYNRYWDISSFEFELNRRNGNHKFTQWNAFTLGVGLVRR